MPAHRSPGSPLPGAAVLLLLVMAWAACPAHSDQRLPEEIALSWIPTSALLPNYCGPAALTSVLRYWGLPADQVAIGQGVFDRRRRGTLAGDLILWARQAGLQACSLSGSRDDLRRWLAAGFPVIVLQDLSPRDRRGHFRVAVGYSDSKRQFLVCDGTEPSLRSIAYDRFDDLWFHFDNWCLLVAPAERIAAAHSLVAGIRLPGDPVNAVLQFDLAEAYLRRGDRETALRHLCEVVRLSPGHRAAEKLLAKLAGSDSSSYRRGDAAAARRP